jgi:hypothetical protein
MCSIHNAKQEGAFTSDLVKCEAATAWKCVAPSASNCADYGTVRMLKLHAPIHPHNITPKGNTPLKFKVGKYNIYMHISAANLTNNSLSLYTKYLTRLSIWHVYLNTAVASTTCLGR